MHMCASVLDISVLLTIGFWNCSDSVVFLELFRQCGIFGTVPTVWICFVFHLNANVPHKSYDRAEIVFSNPK